MRLRVLFTILTIFTCRMSSGQNPDSIRYWEQMAHSAPSEAIQGEYYGKLIGAYIDTEPLTALNYMIDVWINLDSSWAPSTKLLNYDLRLNSNYSWEYDSILKYRIDNFPADGPESQLALLHAQLAFNSFYRGTHENALRNAVKAIEILDRTYIPIGEMMKMMLQFSIYNNSEQRAKAKEIADSFNPSMIKSAPDWYNWTKTYLYTQYYSDLSFEDSVPGPNSDSLLYYCFNLKKYAINEYFDGYASGMIGMTYMNMEKYDEALIYLDEAIKVDYKLGCMSEYARYMGFKARVLMKRGKYDKAIDVLQQILKETSVHTENWAYITAIKNLSDAYSKSGDSKNAFEYLSMYLPLQDSLHGLQIERNAAELRTKYESDEKDKEIEAQKAQLSRQRIINYGSGSIALMLILFLGFVYRSNRQKQKTNVALQKAKDRAEQSEKFKQQFLANMSHEIRTPMNAIMGMTDLVLNSGLDDKQRKYLQSVKKASGNLLHIINDILDISKIEAGKIELEKIDFSVADVVQQVKDILKDRASEKNIQFITNIDQEVPDVLIGDSFRLTQVLMNLTGNAIKFTDKGSVMIEVTGKEGDKIKFSVLDTGIGIPKAKLNAVFESFTQAHSADTRKYGGTGLGLTISKQFIELMGGNLNVESEEGSGTTFSFELNLPEGSKERLQQQNRTDDIDGNILNGMNILLVDDNEDNRIVARDSLMSKANVKITEAINGKDALDKLAAQDFDMILMDVQMPVLDGCEATRQIRSNFPAPKKDIPVIALTASVIRNDLDKCRDAGMNDYVPKPFRLVQLVEVIAKVTGKEINYISRATEGPKNESASNSGDGVTDLNYLQEFCEGDREKMKKYIKIFLDSTPGLLSKLDTALSDKNYPLISSQVHGFKTKFIMMGMNETVNLTAKIEAECAKDNPRGIVIEDDTRAVIGQVNLAAQYLKSI